MDLNEQLIQAITKAVVEQLQGNQPQPHNSEGETLAGKTRMRPMHSYEGAPLQEKQECALCIPTKELKKRLREQTRRKL